MSNSRICFDRLLPGQLYNSDLVLRHVVGTARAAFMLDRLWPNGSTIRIAFQNASAQQRDWVKRLAPEWCHHANLTFEFSANDRAPTDVRISFDPALGSWSHIGTDALQVETMAATMNLGWGWDHTTSDYDESVVWHEFGHLIGMIHEHQNPHDNPIRWDRDQVIQSLSGPPNYWDELTIEHNIFEKYDKTLTNGADFDPQSIMLYPIPEQWTRNEFHTERNTQISDQDKLFAQKVYPREMRPAVLLPILEATRASIGQVGEEDRYTFRVIEHARYTLETLGKTDLLMTLLGPGDRFIAKNNDGGEGKNPRISRDLIPADYTVLIRHNEASGMGEYLIRVLRS